MISDGALRGEFSYILSAVTAATVGEGWNVQFDQFVVFANLFRHSAYPAASQYNLSPPLSFASATSTKSPSHRLSSTLDDLNDHKAPNLFNTSRGFGQAKSERS